ncbi:lycopene beta-cyclase CrtY [Tianweitania sp. BSSL-BM11]|uniref:Lycopene beta-cyclase CrtY n=1 Tax=Tianweitania aestuarii TaxID=2814886 RepID=A0ABS5RQN3_9HYPH|nr:lycopene beta-cyclase CrtY [Tianweitania aestuarii]MBS9719090.1 lycopene beta-cyclase CrtY [Tianweitania aestuarii]
MKDADLIIVGGGLAGGLLALRLQQSRPDLSVLVLESGPTLGGNHTWSFHDDDLTAEQHAFLAPLVVHRWPAQSVRFPAFERRLDAGYNSVASDRFHHVLSEQLGNSIRLNTSVRSIAPTQVVLADGTTLQAPAVIDATGFRSHPALQIRFQSFLGLELRFAEPHGLSAPVIMDATTPQDGGYRFTYLLPFTDTTMLVEDTGYVDDRALDLAELEARITRYCATRGWQIVEEVRREQGVLPITLDADIDLLWTGVTLPRIGLAGSFFHPTTGYSLPDAVRVADLIAEMPQLTSPAILDALKMHAKVLWREQRFFRALNRMLFLAGEQDQRWRVMQRFYKLSEPLIERFYAGQTTTADKLRILAGKPPVPVGQALSALLRKPKSMELS